MTEKKSSLFSRAKKLSRLNDWWNYKLSYLFTPFYFLLIGSDVPTLNAIFCFLALLTYFIFTASFGHIINNLGDLKTDAKASRKNSLSSVSTKKRYSLITVTLFFSFSALILIKAAPIIYLLATIEAALFIIYSLPPLRFKESFIGVIVDSLYAHVIPFAIACLISTQLSSSNPTNHSLLFIIALAWQFFSGLRGIIGHEIDDFEDDLKSGILTAVTRIGLKRSIFISRYFISPLEGILLTYLLLLSIKTSIIPLLGFCTYITYLLIKRYKISNQQKTPLLKSFAWDQDIDVYYRTWLPQSILFLAIFLQPHLWPFALIHTLLFNMRLHGKYVSEMGMVKPDCPMNIKITASNHSSLINITGCYLTSQLTNLNDIGIYLTLKINATNIPVTPIYESNIFSDYYSEHHPHETPVCFYFKFDALEYLSSNSINKKVELIIDANWDHPKTNINLYSGSLLLSENTSSATDP
ncbi:MAG: UbiA family prenyltransferase [Verrucomicrobiota bacterium]